MIRMSYIAICLAIGVMFGWFLPLKMLTPALAFIGTALSIQIAAVFVRLNRGMPTITWAKLEPQETENLTKAIVDLTKEYMAIVGWNAATLFFALGLMIAAPVMSDPAMPQLLPWASQLIVGIFVTLFAVSIARIVYVMWRDYDIVKLQKIIIDLTAKRESEAVAEKAAGDVLANIAKAGLSNKSPEGPTDWH